MSEAPDLSPKPPEMRWSPSIGLLVKERGWWVRVILANGVHSVLLETLDALPTDALPVLVGNVQRKILREAT